MIGWLNKKNRNKWDDTITFRGSAVHILREDARRLNIPLEELLQQYLEVGRAVTARIKEHPDGQLLFVSEEGRSRIDIP